MKFLVSLALLAGSAVAQLPVTPSSELPSIPTQVGSPNSGCLADYILDRCLETEEPKAEACSSSDYECLCRAHEAISTCYNNCPNDARAAAANAQVSSYCAQVTTTSTTSRSTSTTMTRSSDTTDTATATDDEDRVRNTATFSADSPDETDNAAAGVMAGSGGVMLGVAGAALAAML